MHTRRIDDVIRRFMGLPGVIRFFVVFLLTACVLIVLYVIGLAILLALGFRDGCFNGGPSCAIPLTQIIELVVAPLTFILLLDALGKILKNKIVGYRLFVICLVITLVQALIPTNYVYPILDKTVRSYFVFRSPRIKMMSEDLPEYKNTTDMKFSILYPTGWKVEESKPGGRNDEVYAADAYLNFYDPTAPYDDHYRIFHGFDIQVYEHESPEGFIEHRSPPVTPPPYLVNGLAGYEYDSELADMNGTQKIHTYLLMVGFNIFEIRVDRSDMRALQRYIASLVFEPG